MQEVDTEEDPYAARLHRYSGIQRDVMGPQGQCCVLGCTNDFPSDRPGGWWCKYLKEHATNQKDVENVGPVCRMHHDQIMETNECNHNTSKSTPNNRAQATWTNPLDAPVRDMTSASLSSDVVITNELRDPHYVFSRFALGYTASCHVYTKVLRHLLDIDKSVATNVSLSKTVHIVPEDYVPLRHAKTRTRFREHLLRKVHDCHKVQGNLVLFKCVTCKHRIVAFHPDHQPKEELTMTRTYPNAVAEWHTKPDATRTEAASFHKGRCQRCADSLAKVEKDLALQGIATFGAENMMDLLWGLPDVDKLLTPDDGLRFKELHHCFDNATIVEEMLVALLHMQVDICYMRPGRRKQYTGLPSFRKNIIAFPQELPEAKQLFNCWTTLSANDVVNVQPASGSNADVKRARIVSVQNHGFHVEYSDLSRGYVEMERIQQRVKLPWRPEDLRENFIVLRRRIGRSEEHLEKDLRVRRGLLQRILLFLTQRSCWRPGNGEETLHLYYDAFDMRDTHEMQELFPEDAVPTQLNFQNLREEDTLHELRFHTFQDWLVEGKFNCDVAQAMLHTWIHDMRGSDSDTLRDFYDGLVADYTETFVGEYTPSEALPMPYLANFVKAHCSLSAQVDADTDEDRTWAIAELIRDEVALVQAYTTAWRGSGTVESAPPQNVQDELRAETARRVLPWPNISEQAVSPMSDGRLVKAHPLVFPTGCGDLRQPRLRTDFSPLEWTQHVFRYFDGRVLFALRGQRAVWAVFNTAMQQLSYRSGSLLHKQSHACALSKASLRELIDQRKDLVSKLGRFGADLPSTSMQWKREGNELEWIVRQMSWKPPWTHRGQEDIRTDVRNRSATIHPRQPGHDRALVQKSTEADPVDELRQFKQDAAARGSRYSGRSTQLCLCANRCSRGCTIGDALRKG